jgi:hypothetical protein
MHLLSARVAVEMLKGKPDKALKPIAQKTGVRLSFSLHHKESHVDAGVLR